MDKTKELRKGYTTGSCSAAAAAAAARLLINPELPDIHKIKISLPHGEELELPIETIERTDEWVRCAVRKESGDDPDITNGAMIYAKVSKTDTRPGEVILVGGEGVGYVTKPGLACPVGAPAINPVPQKMIRAQVGEEADAAAYGNGLLIEISIPEGVALAKKTFNPKLGIVGGLSILGTTGIVEPMSEQAIIDTIKVEINMKKAVGMDCIILTPGNYGQTFMQDYLEEAKAHTVKCSNYIGESVKYCFDSGFSNILLVGHLGKLVKVAAGAMNTHSKYGDMRMETLANYSKQFGADENVTDSLLECVTTEEAVSVLNGKGLLESVVDLVLQDIVEQLKKTIDYKLNIEVVLYANQHGFLGQTEGTKMLIERMLGEKEWQNYTE